VCSGAAHGFNAALAAAFQARIYGALTGFCKVISDLGQWYVYVPAGILLVAIPAARRAGGFAALLTLGVAAGLNTALKLIFAQPRPDVLRLVTETGYGFPSGHAMNCTAFAGMCLFLVLIHKNPVWVRRLLPVLGVLFALCIGFSRIYLGVHYPLDVLGGYLAGGCVCCAAVCALGSLRANADADPARVRLRWVMDRFYSGKFI